MLSVYVDDVLEWEKSIFKMYFRCGLAYSASVSTLSLSDELHTVSALTSGHFLTQQCEACVSCWIIAQN